MKKKAALHNLGCKVNAYETDKMRHQLETAGYEIVPFDERADVYVINTCSVTNIADRKSRQMVHRARKLNPDAIIVAAGCYIQIKGNDANPDGAADILLDNSQKGQLIEKLNEEWKRRSEFEDQVVSDKIKSGFNKNTEPTSSTTRAFLKVQDGCNQFCSYCIIPYARGRERSRTVSDVVDEVKALAAGGCREVVLSGIHLDSYGKDHGESLISLIEGIHAVDGIERIRLGSLEPQVATEEFVSSLAGLPKVCPHFHLSLQSGCDATLSRMNRKYTTAVYEEGCGRLRAHFDHPAITTDVIVGFPGETEEEFEETKRFAERIGFAEMHIFKYSRRDGTRAAEMENQVPEQVKARRSGEMIALALRMSGEYRRYFIGKERPVLLEEKQEVGGRAAYVGYTPEYVRTALFVDGLADDKSAFDKFDGNLQNKIITGKLCEIGSDSIYYIEI